MRGFETEFKDLLAKTFINQDRAREQSSINTSTLPAKPISNTGTAREYDAYMTALKNVCLLMLSWTNQFKTGNQQRIPSFIFPIIESSIKTLRPSPADINAFNSNVSTYFTDKYNERLNLNSHIPSVSIELPTLTQLIVAECEKFHPYAGDYGAPPFISREQEIEMMPWHNVYKAHFAGLPAIPEDE